MEWISIPLELFAAIVIDLDLVSIVRLEKVCKSWQDNLKNQNIWKEIALRHFPSHNSAIDTENWRDVALTRLNVRRNMREKKCISRAIQSKENLGYYSFIAHSCSVAGNEALITLINEAQNYSYATTSFMAYELVNLNSGERQRLDWLGQPNALLTKNYIITSGGYVTHQTIYAGSDLEVLDRKTGEMFHITISMSNPSSGIMQQNEDENFDTICMASGIDFYVIDLKERTYRQFTAQNEKYEGTTLPFQFHGKYIAYARTIRLQAKSELRLTIIDTESGKQIYFETSNTLLDWAIADNQLFLGTHTDDGVQWVLKNFKGEIIKQHNMKAAPSGFYAQGNVRIFEHVIVFFKRTYMYFFDIYNGQFLCSLEIIGASEYGSPPYLRAISTGKFIFSQKYYTRLIDFESRFITKPIKVSIISPVGFSKTLPTELPDRVPFNTLTDFTRTISEVEPTPDPSFYSSICVERNKENRVSMIFCNDVIREQHAGHLQHRNITASRLFAKEKKLKMHSDINMNPTRFSDGKLLTANTSSFSLKPGDDISDHVVLYNEAFMNGEWVPVDYNDDVKEKI